MRLNGSEQRKIFGGNVDLLNLDGDWIYYRYNCSDKSDCMKLFRIRLDGSRWEKLSEEVVDTVDIAGDWIFYKYGGSVIYKMYMDGTRKEIVY
jgi:hypothetical protein